jgi:hypothetical protein
MILWVMSLYVFSGLLMLLGVYFTISYRPYCTLKSPERELAMELHRKQLVDEPMSYDAKLQLDSYLSQTKKYSFGDFVMFLGVLIHIFIFAGNEWFHLTPLYFLSMFCLLPILINTSNFTPYCFIPFLGLLWKIDKEHSLSHVCIEQKKANGEMLNQDESDLYKSNKFQQKMFEYYRYSLNGGVVLHLSLDVLFALNGNLIIN